MHGYYIYAITSSFWGRFNGNVSSSRATLYHAKAGVRWNYNGSQYFNYYFYFHLTPTLAWQIVAWLLEMFLLNLPKNGVVVPAGLHSDFVYIHQEWRLLRASLKQEIQHRLSSLQFILRPVVLCI